MLNILKLSKKRIDTSELIGGAEPGLGESGGLARLSSSTLMGGILVLLTFARGFFSLYMLLVYC